MAAAAGSLRLVPAAATASVLMVDMEIRGEILGNGLTDMIDNDKLPTHILA